MSKQLSTSVMPYLMIVFTQTENDIALGIENKGVGPAFIKKATLTMDGVVYDEADLEKFLTNLVGYIPSYTYRNLQGRAMSAGERLLYFHFDNEKQLERIDSAFQQHDVKVSMCYCSVHDACWTINSEGTFPCESCE